MLRTDALEPLLLSFLVQVKVKMCLLRQLHAHGTTTAQHARELRIASQATRLLPCSCIHFLVARGSLGANHLAVRRRRAKRRAARVHDVHHLRPDPHRCSSWSRAVGRCLEQARAHGTRSGARENSGFLLATIVDEGRATSHASIRAAQSRSDSRKQHALHRSASRRRAQRAAACGVQRQQGRAGAAPGTEAPAAANAGCQAAPGGQRARRRREWRAPTCGARGLNSALPTTLRARGHARLSPGPSAPCAGGDGGGAAAMAVALPLALLPPPEPPASFRFWLDEVRTLHGCVDCHHPGGGHRLTRPSLRPPARRRCGARATRPWSCWTRCWWRRGA